MAVLQVDPSGVESPLSPQAPSLSPVPTPPGFAAALAGASPNVTRAATVGQGVAVDGSGYLPVTAPASALIIISADPVAPVNGQFWVRSDLNEFRWREGGVTYKVAGTAV